MAPLERKATIIAVCGLDGSGKTTLWQNIQNSQTINNSVFLNRVDRRDWRNLFSLHSVEYEQETMSSSSAVWLRWAHAFDMLEYFKHTVEPLLNKDVVIISDRWSYCSQAFAFGMHDNFGPITEMLSVIPDANLVLYPQVDPEDCIKRIQARGKIQADETLDELFKLKRGYENVLSNQRTIYLTSKTREELLEEALSNVKKLLNNNGSM